MMILNERGKEFTDADDRPARFCPRCDANEEKALKVNAFGGHWSIICACGYEFEHGRDPR